MAQGGGFYWQTNITDVARKTESALARIRAATQKLSGQQASIGGAIGKGVDQRVRGVETQLRNRLRGIGNEFTKEMEAATKRGERFSGRVRNRTFQQATQRELDQAFRNLEKIGREAGRGLPRGMEHMRGAIQTSLQDVGRNLAAIYKEDVGKVQQRLNAARQATGARMERGVHFGTETATVARASRATQRASGLLVPQGAEDVVEQQRALAATAKGVASKQEISRLGSEIRTSRQQLESAQATEKRVTAEARANIRPDGTLRDPRGADISSRGARDAAGRVYQHIKDESGMSGMVRAQPGTPWEDFLDERKDMIRQNRQEAMAGRREEQQALEKQKGTQRQLRQSVDARLSEELRTGRALQVNQGLIRDQAGRFYRMAQVAGERTPVLQTQRTVGPTTMGQMRDQAAKAEAQQLKQQGLVERQRAAQNNLRRTVDQRLSRELELGKAMRVSNNLVQDAAGRFYRFNQVAGKTVPVLQTERTAGPTQMARMQAQADATRLAAEERARRAAARQQAPTPMVAPAGAGGGGGPLDRIMKTAAGGGQGRGLTGPDILQNVMAYSRYFISATMLMGTIAALRTATQVAVDYRESLTDLEVAMGDGGRASQRFIAGLSDISRFAGESTASAIDSAIRGIRAFVPMALEGDAFDDAAEQMGTSVALASQQLAVIAEKELKDATGDVISIGFAFNLNMESAEGEIREGIDAFGRIPAAISNAKRTLAGDAKEIAQGLSSIGTAAGEAGFTLEETANLVSLIQARTDQSGRAVATRLGRIFSIVGGSAGRSAIEQLNMQLDPSMRVDTTGSVRDQLMGIASIYQDLSDQQQNQIRSALGGTANIRELIPLLQSPTLLLDAMDESFENAGAGASEFQRKADDLAGTLRQLRGNVQTIVTALFEAGIGDLFLGLFKAIVPTLDAVRQLLNFYNRVADALGPIGTGLQTLLVLQLQLNAAAKIWAAAMGAGLVQRAAGSGLAQRGAFMAKGLNQKMKQPMGQGNFMPWWMFGGGGGRGPARVPGAGIDAQFGRAFDTSAMQASRLKLIGASVAGTVGNIGGAFARLGGTLMRFIAANPLLALAGGILAVVRAWDASRNMMADTAAAREMLTQQDLGTEASPKDLREMAHNMHNQAEETRRTSRGFGALADALQGHRGKRAADALETRARQMYEFSKTLEDAQREAARGTDPADAIRLETSESVSESMNILEEQGRDATTRMNALGEAIRRAGEDAAATTRTLGELEQLQFSFDLGDRLRSQIWDAADAEANLSSMDVQSGTGAQGRRSAADLLLPPWLRKATGWGTEPSGWGWVPGVDFGKGAIDVAAGATAGVTGSADFTEKQMEPILGFFDDVNLQGELDDLILQAVQSVDGELDDDNLQALEEFIMQWVSRNMEDFDDLGEEGAEWLQGQISAGLTNVANAYKNALDDPAVAIAAANEMIQVSEAAAQELDVQRRLSGGGSGRGATVDAAQMRLSELKQARADLAKRGRDGERIDPAAFEQLDRAIEQAELTAIEARQARIDRLSKLAQSEMAQTDTIGREREEVSRIQEQLRATSDQERKEELRAELNEARMSLAQSEVDRSAAEHMAWIDSRDTVGTARANSINVYRQLQHLVAQGDTSSERYWQVRKEYADSLLEEAQRENELAAASRAAARDPRDEVGRSEDAIRNALDSLNAAKEGTVGYEQAMEEYRRAVHDDAELKRRIAQTYRRASIDPRDTIRRAAEDVRSAAEDVAAAFPGTQAHADAQERHRQAMHDEAELKRETAQAYRRASIDPRDTIGRAADDVRRAAEEVRASFPGTKEHADAQEAYRAAVIDQAKERRAYAAAARMAGVDPESSVQQARAGLENARDELRGARRGTIEFEQARAEYNKAQVDYANALIEAQSRARQVAIDLTDPVATAREALQTARQKLRAAQRRGAPQDVIDEREIEVQNAQAQAEAAAFQQRFNDVKHANDMGRMSHAAYISYLQSERERLMSITSKSRQQIEQIQQIDQALKAATDQMHGQFNIGDIKIPTPYEVRRAIEAEAAGVSAAVGAHGTARAVGVQQSVTENTILVNGADTAEVTRILKQILGPQAMGRNSAGSSGSRRI